MNLSLFNDEQQELLIDRIRSLVPFELTDYAVHVLHPEIAIRIVMTVNGLTYEAAESELYES